LAVVVGDGAAVREVLRFGSAFAELVFVFDTDDESLGGLRAAIEEEVECLDCSAADFTAVLDAHRRAPLTAITTFAEDKIRLTASLAESLGLRYHSVRTAAALTDKGVQRAVLGPAGLGLDFRVATDARHAVELVRELAVPCVVKPVTSSGSRNTYAVDPANAAEVLGYPPETYPAVVETRLANGRHPGSDLFSDIVSVETVFSGGRPHHIGLSGRFRLAEPFRETGMVAPARVPPDLQETVCAMASRALEALDVTTGATHTEIKLTPTGPRVIEVNGRIGGFVGRLTELTTGTNAVELTLRGVCDLPIVVPVATFVAGVHMLVPPLDATRLVSRVPAKALRAIDGVVSIDVRSRPGEAVDYRTGWWAHVGCVWYRAADWPALDATHRAVQALVAEEMQWA
jgi:biotin carboxylase